MKIIRTNNLCCPIDSEALSFEQKQLVCPTGHSFDIARQGYVNLLPVQHKRSKDPGDSKEMVIARTQYLNTGLYEPIAKKLTELSYQILKTNTGASCILDAGCGEGYYSNYLVTEFEKNKTQNVFSVIGLDISKFAIVEAAKRNKKITWLVGTNRQPPLLENSVDLIICIFGFQSFEGFNKILKDGGQIVLVEPGPNHLKELREIIYDDVKKTDPPNISDAEKFGISVVATEQLQFKTGEIKNDLIQSLLLMTPHFFRANKAGREAALNLQQIDLSVDVVFRMLRKADT